MYYWVYGFALKSDFELPELREITREEAEAGPPPIVEIVNGPVPEALPGERRLASWFSFSSDRLLFQIENIARFLVECNRKITVEVFIGADEADMRTYLLGSCLAAIVHQRGLLPLHVSAVLSPKGAIAFTGPPGAGKSTSAMRIHKELGWPLISDDVAVVRTSREGTLIESGVKRGKLWKDALDRLGISADRLRRDLLRLEKYQFTDSSLFVGGEHPLLVLVELNSAAESPISLRAPEAFTALMNSIYRPLLVPLSKNVPANFFRVARVSDALPVYRLSRNDTLAFVGRYGSM